MNTRKRGTLLLLVLCALLVLPGCQSLLRLTYRNEDFKWVEPKDLAKIIIQSTRDVGFRFVVTDKETMGELRESLSTALPVEERNSLAPDYIFEFHTYDNRIIKYYYTTGTVNEDHKGNFYNDTKQYVVLNRIDNQLIRNLFALRKPQSFYEGYYGSVLQALKTIAADHEGVPLAVLIGEDKEMLKFQMSYEILDFNVMLSERGMRPVQKDRDGDVVVIVNTVGYKTNLYKAILKVQDNTHRKTTRYYVVSHFNGGKWTTTVTQKAPEGF
ncbi:hypothetical protein ABB02_00041 [Clostridiaceae bacterium JG1575]|nr:hypothetical protein ABB02_00041 [Clostridiaceae bacterium JG1575]